MTWIKATPNNYVNGNFVALILIADGSVLLNSSDGGNLAVIECANHENVVADILAALECGALIIDVSKVGE